MYNIFSFLSKEIMSYRFPAGWRSMLLSGLVIVLLQRAMCSDANSPESFGFQPHKELLSKAVTILQSGQCKHIYLDVGTNVGVQIRKL